MQTEMKKVLGVYSPGSEHWVGNGFQVRNFSPSNDLDGILDPFLLVDYAIPTYFPPSQQPAGVGEHPHRGFETVTLVYSGCVAHRDSQGNQGIIGPGEVQWMTAASGVLHEEMHEQTFAKQGGIVEMVQLWVNLPKTHKMSSPGYQTLYKAQIPVVQELGQKSYLRIIAGAFQGHLGPAKTVTPINLWEVFISEGETLAISLPESFNTGVLVRSGQVIFQDTAHVSGDHLVILSQQGERLLLEAQKDTQLLILNGQPISEPIVRHGPFVMNTREEIHQAFLDYRSGLLGQLK